MAKDRALDWLREILAEDAMKHHGYFNWPAGQKKALREVAMLLALKDDSELTLKAMDSYINGEEEAFFL